MRIWNVMGELCWGGIGLHIKLHGGGYIRCDERFMRGNEHSVRYGWYIVSRYKRAITKRYPTGLGFEVVYVGHVKLSDL